MGGAWLAHADAHSRYPFYTVGFTIVGAPVQSKYRGLGYDNSFVAVIVLILYNIQKYKLSFVILEKKISANSISVLWRPRGDVPVCSP
jgi:hypothetical protein